MKTKASQRFLNILQIPKEFVSSTLLAVIVAEIFLCLVESTGALRLQRSRNSDWNSRSHRSHTYCAEGYCAKRWNCRYPITPTVSCGKWNQRKWVCCTDNVGWDENGWQSPTTQPPTRPDIVPNPDIHVAGCGIRGHIVEPRANVTGRRADPDSEYVIFNQGNHSHTWNREMMPLPDAVVGGREVDPYSWPWMAAIRRDTDAGISRFVCAGTLISHRYVLTAAHVFLPSDVRNPRRFLVVLGSHITAEGIGVRAETITVHPSYRARLYYHDIALVRLEWDVTFNDFVRPICLPKSADQESSLVGQEVTVIGWGDDAFGGISSPILKEASFPVVSMDTCNNSYIRIASSTFPRGITRDMICAGSPSGGKDACQGDSGGPLAMEQGARWVIVGIVSFGYRCGDSEYPGVYTKVSSYMNWIAECLDIIQR